MTVNKYKTSYKLCLIYKKKSILFKNISNYVPIHIDYHYKFESSFIFFKLKSNVPVQLDQNNILQYFHIVMYYINLYNRKRVIEEFELIYIKQYKYTIWLRWNVLKFKYIYISYTSFSSTKYEL